MVEVGVTGVKGLRPRAESVTEAVSYRGKILAEKGENVIWRCEHRHETAAEARLCAEGEIIRRGAEEEQKRWH